MLPARIDEQFRDAHIASNRKPRSQAGGNSFPESKDALLPSFSHYMDIHVARTKRRITDFETDQFGNAKTASERFTGGFRVSELVGIKIIDATFRAAVTWISM